MFSMLRYVMPLLLFAFPALADTWTVTPFQPAVPVGGRAVAVTVNPADGRIAVVASESGGLFMTRDSGATWSHVDAVRPHRMIDVAYAPGRGDIILATAGNDMSTVNPIGIWRSDDGGRTWSQPMTPDACLRPPSASAYGISFQPGSERVVVGTACGIAISEDLGATWRSVAGPPAAGGPAMLSVEAAPGGAIHACTQWGLWRQPFPGSGWIGPTAGAGGCDYNTLALDTSPYEPNVVFYADGQMRVYESDDSGATWMLLRDSTDASRPGWVRTAPLPGGTVFELFWSDGLRVYRQTCRRGGTTRRCDAGATRMDMRADPNSIAFHPSTGCPQYMVTDGGIHRFEPPAPGAPCSTRHSQVASGTTGYNALQLYEVQSQRQATGWRDDLYIGTQDNNLWASIDGGVTWPGVVHSEGFALQVAPHASLMGAGTVQGVACFSCNPFQSRRGFTSVSEWHTPEPWRNTAVMPPQTGRVTGSFLIAPGVYAVVVQTGPVEMRVFTTRNTGATWTDAGRLPYVEMRGTPSIVGPAGNPSLLTGYKKPDVAGLGDRTGLARIDNILPGRATWVFLDRGTGAPDNIAAFGMGAASFGFPWVYSGNPRDPLHMMLVDGADGSVHVTRDGGMNWTRDDLLNAQVRGAGPAGTMLLVGGDWGGVQVHSIAFHPRNNEIFVGTESRGIFYSADDGRTWQQVPNSLPITAVSNFAFGFDGDRDREVVYVATYGRGLWKLRRVPEPRLGGGGGGGGGGTPFRYLPWYLAVFDPWSSAILYDPVTGGPLRFPIGSDACPRCTLALIESGRVRDLAGDGGRFKTMGVDGKLHTFDLIGKEIEPPFAYEYSGNDGSFEACPACSKLMSDGTALAGVVLEEGKLLAVVALPPAAEQPPPAPQFEAAPPTPPAGPYIALAGGVPGAPLTAVAPGEPVSVFGSGFCGKPECGLVTIRVGDEVVADQVKVSGNGLFQAAFTLDRRPTSTSPNAPLPVRATQRGEGQRTYSDSSLLLLTRHEGPEDEKREETGTPNLTATLRAEPADYSGPCPGTIHFAGEITGTVSDVAYTFVRSDGATGPVEKVSLASGKAAVSTTWTLSTASYSGWQALKIVSPLELTSNQAEFRFTCK
jgi:photosystem II stability/assembly factor-like uncharacterized protein